MSLKGARRFVSRLTALLAAADSERCPAPPEGAALTLTGRGRLGQSFPSAPDAAQAGPWLPRTKWATRRPARVPACRRVANPEFSIPAARPNQSLQRTGAPARLGR